MRHAKRIGVGMSLALAIALMGVLRLGRAQQLELPLLPAPAAPPPPAPTATPLPGLTSAPLPEAPIPVSLPQPVNPGPLPNFDPAPLPKANAAPLLLPGVGADPKVPLLPGKSPDAFRTRETDPSRPPAFRRVDGTRDHLQASWTNDPNPVVKMPAFRLLTEPRPKEDGPVAPGPLEVGADPLDKDSPPLPRSEMMPIGQAYTPALSVAKFRPPQIKPGEPFTYEIVVRNHYMVHARQVLVEDEVPAGTRIVGTQPQAKLQGNRLSWVIEELHSPFARRFQVQAITSQPENWNGNAQVSVTAQTNQNLVVQQAAAPQLKVTTPPKVETRTGIVLGLTGPGVVELGQKAVFSLRVTNNTGAAIKGLIMRVKLAAGLEHLQGNYIEADLGSMKAGESSTMNLECITTQPGRPAVQIMVKGLDGKLIQAEAAVEIREPALVLRVIPPEHIAPKEPVTLRLEIENRSKEDIANIAIYGPLPREGLILGGPEAKGQEPKFALPQLPAGKTHTFALGQVLPTAGPQEIQFELCCGEGTTRTFWSYIVRVDQQK